MIDQLIIILVLSLFAGIAYRLGGTSAGTKWRDVGVPVIALLAMIALGLWHWSLILASVLLFASMTAYHKWVGKLLGLGGEDVFWPSWAVTGLFYGLSMIPYAYFTGLWLAFGIRCLALAILTAVWSHFIDDVNFEEGGRGFLIIISLLIFLL